MNNYQKLLGKKKDDKEFIHFEANRKDAAVLREKNVEGRMNKTHDYELLYKEDGILLTFLDDKVIKIKVYFTPTPICKPYIGEFVFGLTHISSENDIKKQFEFPQNLNQAPMRADNIYQYENCWVAFDAMTGEINYAEIEMV